MQSLGVIRYRTKILNRITESLDLKNKNILDIGCGNGIEAKTLALSATSVTGVDIKFYKEWNEYWEENLRFQVADACHLPFSDSSFDIAYEKDVLHHLRTPSKALKEMGRVTKSGGHIILVEANRYNPISYFHMVLMCGHQHLSQRKFLNLLQSHLSSCAPNFFSTECHAYPSNNAFLLCVLKGCEDLIDKVPIFLKFRSYNIFIAQK